MKKITLIFSLLAYVAIQQINAQPCAACTPINCSALKPTGGLCNSLPDDTVGIVYDEVISFYMPKQLTDPATIAQCSQCDYVRLRKITVVGIQGMPPGLSYTASQGGVYQVANGDSTGCVRFCGTPVAPGTYIIIVNLLADVTAVGTLIGDVDANNQAQTYRDTLTFYPSVSDCPLSYSLGSAACVTKACDSVAVDLSALLTNPFCNDLISYSWSFGNGNTSTLKDPGFLNYNTPDTFPLTLTTTYYSYRIKSVYVQAKSCYTGDIEELTGLSNPDPYITIPALGFNNKATAGSDNKIVTFNNLNIVIPYADCASPVNITVWDLDDGPPFGSNDDNLNTHAITPSLPNQVSSFLSCSDVSVTFDTVAVSSVTETVNIIVYPQTPTPQVILQNDSFCSGDSTLMTFSPILPGYLYNWYFNDTTELINADTALFVKLSGNYSVRITNESTGCTEISQNFPLLAAQAAPNSISVIFNGTSAFVSPFPSTGFAVDWFFNGNLVTGQNGKFLPFLGNGEYRAELYNIQLPECRRSSGGDTIVSGLNDLKDYSVSSVNIYPNPNAGKFTLKFLSEETQAISISVKNVMGQTVLEKKLPNFIGDFNEEINISEFSKGVYFVNIQTEKGNKNVKVVVQ